jgi:hypothetical protein
VADYDHEEEEQIETLKAWWKENGSAVNKEGCHKEYKRYKYHVISLLN